MYKRQIKTLCSAITQPHPTYSDIGVKSGDGSYQQLSDSLLQIENEFYSVIRPKRTAERGETALSALANRGVEYIEVRCLDINPYLPVGINQEQIDFLDTFLLYCLLADSPQSDTAECADIKENQSRMVYEGRDPDVRLIDKGNERPMREWGNTLMSELEAVAQCLDQANNNQQHSNSVIREKQKLNNAELTPSAQILADMRAQDVTFYQLAANLSTFHQQHFEQCPLGEQGSVLAKMANASITEQHALEQETAPSFDDYLANYYSQYTCGQP